MAFAKNKYSSKIHTSKTQFLSSHQKSPTQKITLTIIIIATLAVASAVICSLIFDSEHLTKAKISNLARDYYENHFYQNITTNKNELSDVMSKYTETGFNSISLHQIILSTDNDHSTDANFIRKYCDEKSTIIRFFPEPPFDKTSYHVEYSYSCDF